MRPVRAVPVQLRLTTRLTSEEYVSRQAWRDATLEYCPLHPQGGCGFVRHGTYERAEPPGAHIARWYCRKGHCTFSLLPDCLAARFTGSLLAFEEAVACAEESQSLERAADRLRPEVTDLFAAVRWLRRRRTLLNQLFSILRGLVPELFADCLPQVGAFRSRLDCDCALVRLRAIAASWLGVLPPPLGFGPWPKRRGDARTPHQHSTGPDPPSTSS
jgi:hypothetical protein